MTLHIEPELNVPVLDDNPFADLTVSIGSAANTALFLAEHGLDIEPTKEDKDIAATPKRPQKRPALKRLRHCDQRR